MTNKMDMILKILKVKSDIIKIHKKIPSPFNQFVKPNTDITQLLKYFERIK